jgi:hypothetical protein
MRRLDRTIAGGKLISMKVTLELEVGPETGLVSMALESQIKMLKEAKALRPDDRAVDSFIAATTRIRDEIEAKVRR